MHRQICTSQFFTESDELFWTSKLHMQRADKPMHQASNEQVAYPRTVREGSSQVQSLKDVPADGLSHWLQLARRLQCQPVRPQSWAGFLTNW